MNQCDYNCLKVFDSSIKESYFKRNYNMICLGTIILVAGISSFLHPYASLIMMLIAILVYVYFWYASYSNCVLIINDESIEIRSRKKTIKSIKLTDIDKICCSVKYNDKSYSDMVIIKIINTQTEIVIAINDFNKKLLLFKFLKFHLMVSHFINISSKSEINFEYWDCYLNLQNYAKRKTNE